MGRDPTKSRLKCRNEPLARRSRPAPGRRRAHASERPLQ
ncbi:Hypothetical protein A7982_08497 [Minicystis rosea]|nr:Hypothetical protein A7982_08497 [Minicystis rosea]